mgnify:CR=1 FL=1
MPVYRIKGDVFLNIILQVHWNLKMVQTRAAGGQLKTTHITYTDASSGDSTSRYQTERRTDVSYTSSSVTKRTVTLSSIQNGSSVSSHPSGNLKTHPTVYIVFVSLLLDLLAFTMILPLLPSLLDHYSANDNPDGLYPWLLEKVRYFQEFVGAPDRFNSVLFGGKIHSLF